MSLQDLALKLRADASSGRIPLTAAMLTGGTDLILPSTYDADVARALGLPSSADWLLTVRPQQIPDPTATELRITAGTTTLTGLGLTDHVVDLRFTIAAEGSQALTVTAELVLTDWTFATSFPFLGGYPVDQMTYDEPSFVFASQLVVGFPAQAAAITAEPGLNFACLLRMDQLLKQTLPYLTPTRQTFPFFGIIDLTAPIVPNISLRADLAGTLAELPPLKLHSPFVEYRVRYSTTTAKRSTVYLFGMQLDIGDGISVDFTAQLLPDPIEFVLGIAGDPQAPMTPAALFQLVGGQSWGPIPAPLRQALEKIALKDLAAQMLLTPGAPSINTLSTRTGSTQPVQLFGQFTLNEFDAVWVLRREAGAWDSSLEFEASFEFYKELFDGEFQVTINTAMQLWGSFTGEVSFADVLRVITGGAVTPPSNVDLVLTDFTLWLDAPKANFSLFLGCDALFDPLGTGVFVLSSAQITLASQASNTGRAYSARLDAMLVMAGFPLTVNASYDSTAGWDFLAAMPPGATVSIKDFLASLFPGAAIPTFLSDVLVSNVKLAAHLGGTASNSVDTGATLLLRNVDLGPLGRYNLDASATLRHVGGTVPVTSGSFVFGTTIPGIGARVTIGYAFSGSARQVVSVAWGAFVADYDITKAILRFSVGEATFGGVLGQIIGLVIGEDGYRLPPPWSVLNSLSLRGFGIEFDLGATPRTVTVVYSLSQPVDLGFITLRGLRIGKVNDKVTVSLDATFVGGAPVPPFEPLNGTPPVPGSGSLVDLRLLALGQRVTVPGIEKAATVDAAVKALGAFKDTPANGLPVGPTFDAGAPWLVGVHILFVAGTFDIEVVFVDPLLYGLRVALAGEKAGPFKGLDFEVMYKKVTDTIGVYQARLKLPDAMRLLQFGVLAITLPNVGLDVYTDGDFRIDFGFPANNDFSRSFGIQYFPFTGAGGFYFAKLSAATAKSTPKPSTPGTFDPVFEFGLGLQVGLGKDLSAGILRAGLSLTVFGVVEGVIATWNPAGHTPADPTAPTAPVNTDSADIGEAYYYRVAGTIGIVGKIYGSVDFAIIKANLNLTVSIGLQAVIEAHRPFHISFTAAIDVALTVKIDLGLFDISIHLSFSMKVKESFVLGSATAAPWGSIESSSPNTRPALTAEQRNAFVERLDFAPFRAVDAEDERAQIHVDFLMQPSVAGDPTDASTTGGKLVAMLYIDGPDPGAAPAPAPALGDPLPPAATSFERFAETVFAWVVAAFGGQVDGAAADDPYAKPTLTEFLSTPVDRTRVAAAYEYLTSTTVDRPIRYEADIVRGLFPNLTFVMSAAKTLSSAVPLPMIPELRLEVGDLNRRFDQSTVVDNAYLAKLRAYFDELAAEYQDELEKKYAAAPAAKAKVTDDAGVTSYCAAVFEDVVLMLARGMLRAGLDVFDACAYLYGGKSLSTIANELTAMGNAVSPANSPPPTAACRSPSR
ncbi:hypothetical protein ACFQ9X_30125 [Catenulispora yoronensis]